MFSAVSTQLHSLRLFCGETVTLRQNPDSGTHLSRSSHPYLRSTPCKQVLAQVVSTQIRGGKRHEHGSPVPSPAHSSTAGSVSHFLQGKEQDIRRPLSIEGRGNSSHGPAGWGGLRTVDRYLWLQDTAEHRVEHIDWKRDSFGEGQR